MNNEVGLILVPNQNYYELEKLIKSKSFIGIDFGTSTTVVSIIIVDNNKKWMPRTLQIKQFDGKISYTQQEIVNTVLAWHGNNLLFGQPAYELKSKLKAGKNIFYSFKMNLGFDYGPNYPNTDLSRIKNKGYIIETAVDAAALFFKLLNKEIYNALNEYNLSSDIKYAISVPASFQDTQRRDLLKALKYSGINIEQSCFIDEPNAAFLSYFYQSYQEENGEQLLKDIHSHHLNILVYDFGAGTCDISILKISIENNIIKSQNLAISRFTALGGDNIDRAIADEVLYEKITWKSINLDLCPINKIKNEVILPRLMPVAEKLKISMINLLTSKEISSVYEIEDLDLVIEEKPLNDLYKSQRLSASLNPTLSTQEFKKVMLPFVGDDEYENSSSHVCKPIFDALDKAGIELDDLYGVLFIGGSSQNPLVRAAVMGIMPSSVKALIPRNLRIHVSQGAAIHSLGHHAVNFDFITPVTAENINLITIQGKLHPLIGASTPVPSPKFTTNLMVAKNNQKVVEVPVCLTSNDRLLGVLRFTSTLPSGFNQGESITISGQMTQDKMLEVKAYVYGKEVSTAILSPLTSQDVSPIEKDYLQSLKRYREESLKMGGEKNVSMDTVLDLIDHAKECGRYEEVVDLYKMLEANFSKDFSTQIAHYLSCLGQKDQAFSWFKIAYERNKNEITAYNYALNLYDAERIAKFKESLDFNPCYVPALILLGKDLLNKDGDKYLNKALDILNNKKSHGNLSDNNLYWFKKAADLLGKIDLLDEIIEIEKNRKKSSKHTDKSKSYDDNNLLIDDAIHMLK